MVEECLTLGSSTHLGQKPETMSFWAVSSARCVTSQALSVAIAEEVRANRVSKFMSVPWSVAPKYLSVCPQSTVNAVEILRSILPSSPHLLQAEGCSKGVSAKADCT